MKRLEDLILPFIVNYLEKDPVRNSKKFLNAISRYGLLNSNNDDTQKNRIDAIYEQLENPENQWYGFIKNMRTTLNENARKKLIGSFLLKASLFQKGRREKMRKKQQIPSIILMDPTSACNLKCTGCWALDYKKTHSMSFELLERIIREGKKLNIFTYIYSGGEPLLRKKDLLKLAEKHPECYFLAFTNGTLVDEDFAKEVARLGNFAVALSIEGFEENTDFRRGKGTYKKVIRAMDLMHEYGNLFGFSATYHRLNNEAITSNEFLDYMREKGNYFGWFFSYMPVGSDARPELIITPKQREYTYHKLREYRKKNPLFIMDFWNDGGYTGGCIAGGRQYIHINAKGDVEPCAFIHYSGANIKDTSLKEALRQPLFEQYRKHHPFNHNHLQPCPCLDNPEKLRLMVNNSKAKSTQLMYQETVEELTRKCEEHASGWDPIADSLSKQKDLTERVGAGILQDIKVAPEYVE